MKRARFVKRCEGFFKKIGFKVPGFPNEIIFVVKFSHCSDFLVRENRLWIFVKLLAFYNMIIDFTHSVVYTECLLLRGSKLNHFDT